MLEQDKNNLEQLIVYCKMIHQKGDVPATSGNFSVLSEDSQTVYITRSGKHKGFLVLDDFMPMQRNGQYEIGNKPSAESALHTQIYQYSSARAVLHSHSKAAIKLAMRTEANVVTLKQYELLKAFEGIDTHNACLDIPIVENSQDMSMLSASVEPYFNKSTFVAYIIEGHGLYVWAENLTRTWHYLEALEYLFDVELSKNV